MNVRDLRYLVALADLKHFGRAAEACHVGQPTLSMQIKKLEDELGVQLFERMPRTILLTEAGTSIVRCARAALAEIDQIRQIAKRTLDPEAGSVRLGFFPTLGPYLLPHVIPRVHARFPDLELLLFEEKTEDVIRQLREGRLDAGVLALPVDDDTLHAEVLFDEPFVLALPKRHELASRRQITLDDLSQQSLLLLEDGHCLRRQALEVCELAGASERSGFRATSLETLRQMVAAEVGLTLLPVLAVKPPIAQSENVRILPFREPAPHRRIAMVWRKSSAQHEFLSKLAAVFRDLPEGLLRPDARVA